MPAAACAWGVVVASGTPPTLWKTCPVPHCPGTPGHPSKQEHPPAPGPLRMEAPGRGLTGYPSIAPLSHTGSPGQGDTAVPQQPGTLTQPSQLPVVSWWSDALVRAPRGSPVPGVAWLPAPLAVLHWALWCTLGAGMQPGGEGGL